MLFFCAVGMTMIIYSPYILSNALIGLICCALFDIQLDPFRLRFHPKLKTNLSIFWKSRAFWITTLIFFITLISSLYSTDVDYIANRLRLKIPFLIIPFTFFALPRLTLRSYQGLFYFLVVILFLTNLGIGANYLLHFEEINRGITLGQPIPVPRNHVRFSLLLAVGILAGMILIYRKFYLRYSIERWLIAAMTLFNFIFIHILSVRSGLMVLYITMLVGCLALIFLQRKFLIGVVSIACIVLLPIIAFYTIPSFASKVSYANWELHEFRNGRMDAGSDQGRIKSYIIGWDIFTSHPLIGVGAGDLRQTVHGKYAELYPTQEKKLMPHNQFLTIMAGTGLIGLLLFLLAIFYPFFAYRHYRDPFFFVFFLAFLLSFLVESTLENSIGIGFYVLFLGICLSYLTGARDRVGD
jgi:O-antigen ligase